MTAEEFAKIHDEISKKMEFTLKDVEDLLLALREIHTKW
jgi:hypothetical protein